MKKISLIALLVLVGLFFAAPAIQAQEAENTAAKEKAKKLAEYEDDEQLGNFLASLNETELSEIVAAVVESGDTALLERVSNALKTMGTDVASVLAGGAQAAEGTDQPASEGESKADSDVKGKGYYMIPPQIFETWEFFTSNPVVNTASLSRPEAE